MAVVRRQPEGLEWVLVHGYLWATLLVSAAISSVVVAGFVTVRPLESSRGGDCGTWWKPSELSRYEDEVGRACGDAVTEAWVVMGVLVVLALTSGILGLWLIGRTHSHRRRERSRVA